MSAIDHFGRLDGVAPLQTGERYWTHTAMSSHAREEKPLLFPPRFEELCACVGIHADAHEPHARYARYDALRRRVRGLMMPHYLAQGELRLADPGDVTSGCVRVLQNAKHRRPSDGKIAAIVRRIHGLVRDGGAYEGKEQVYRLPPRADRPQFDANTGRVLSDDVRRIIESHCDHGLPGAALEGYFQGWEDFLSGTRSTPPAPLDPDGKAPLTSKVQWFLNAHGYIGELNTRVSQAKSDVTFVGVSFSVSTKQGVQHFLRALEREAVRLRFLVFDFANNDLEPVARNLGLSPATLALRCKHTLDALAQVQHAAGDSGQRRVEIRFFDVDPGMRCYIVDRDLPENGVTFVFPRMPQSIDGPGLLVLNDQRDFVEFYTRKVEQLWESARTWEQWAGPYGAWLSRASTQQLLRSDQDDEA